MAGTPPTVPGCSKPCPAWPWALPGIQGGHPVPGPAHPAREQFLPNLPSIPALWQWEPFPVSCPSRPCPQSLSSSPGAPSGPARGSELSLELLLSRGAPPALPAWLQGRGSPCPVPAHSAPCVPLGGLWLWGSHGGSGAVCGLRGVQGAGLGLPTDLPRPPGPARCPSSGGGGGGGRGGGGSGAGTALEAAAAGQLRRDGGPAVPPSRYRAGPARDGVWGRAWVWGCSRPPVRPGARPATQSQHRTPSPGSAFPVTPRNRGHPFPVTPRNRGHPFPVTPQNRGHPFPVTPRNRGHPFPVTPQNRGTPSPSPPGTGVTPSPSPIGTGVTPSPSPPGTGVTPSPSPPETGVTPSPSPPGTGVTPFRHPPEQGSPLPRHPPEQGSPLPHHPPEQGSPLPHHPSPCCPRGSQPGQPMGREKGSRKQVSSAVPGPAPCPPLWRDGLVTLDLLCCRNRPFPQAVPSLPALGAIPHAGEAEAQQAGGAGGEAVAEPGGEGKCPAGASQAHQVGAAPRGGASQPHFPPVPLQSPPPMPPSRSRTYESSCKEAEQAATGRQGPPSPSLSKQDSSYRRVFGGLAEQDALLGCFSCAWQREMPYHGRLYVSSRHICFHSSLLLKDIKAVVPVASISALKKTNTALLVPNAISIRTAKGEKFLFVALRQREATYQLLRSVCKHLQDSGQSSRDSASWEETLGKSQMLSQSAPEQSTPEPNSLQEALGHLDCSLGHSPSVSRSPADEPNLRSRQAEDEDGEVALLVPRSSEWVPSAKTHGLWGRPHSVLCAWATALWSWINPQLSSLNIIITIYLLLMVALLLSSGYIGLRIAELEQQLSFAGAGPDLNLSQQYKTT
uniref:GRAM domain-containing protein n=1 Tax=Taeniopygia guttata TaxID=59729 RepID=A0A674GFX4_TAEGU